MVRLFTGAPTLKLVLVLVGVCFVGVLFTFPWDLLYFFWFCCFCFVVLLDCFVCLLIICWFGLVLRVLLYLVSAVRLAAVVDLVVVRCVWFSGFVYCYVLRYVALCFLGCGFRAFGFLFIVLCCHLVFSDFVCLVFVLGFGCLCLWFAYWFVVFVILVVYLFGFVASYLISGLISLVLMLYFSFAGFACRLFGGC